MNPGYLVLTAIVLIGLANVVRFHQRVASGIYMSVAFLLLIYVAARLIWLPF